MTPQRRPPAVEKLLGETSDVLVVPAELVASLRGGLQDELGTAAKVVGALMHEFEGDVPVEELQRCLSKFDAARALLTRVGFADLVDEQRIALTIGADAPLLLRALDGRRILDLNRLHEMGLYGLDADAAEARVEGIEELMRRLRRHLPPRRGDPDDAMTADEPGAGTGHRDPGDLRSGPRRR
jgi:hypothetical protein